MGAGYLLRVALVGALYSRVENNAFILTRLKIAPTTHGKSQRTNIILDMHFYLPNSFFLQHKRLKYHIIKLSLFF